MSRTSRLGVFLLGAASLAVNSTTSGQDAQLLAQVFPRSGPNPSSNPRGFVSLPPWVFSRSARGVLRFAAGGGNPRVLWTEPVSDLAVAGRKLFMVTAKGTRLYVSDGTSRPQPIRYDSPFSPPIATAELTPLGGRLIFVATSFDDGREIWSTDGTANGTIQLADIFAGKGGSNPRDLTAHGNQVFFVANDGVRGEELWRTDGTPAGTALVKDIVPGPGWSAIRHLVGDGPRLWFFAADGAGVHRLWTSLGAANTTVAVALARPDATLLPLGTAAMFLQTRNLRTELWTSDGTARGTRRLEDVGPSSTKRTGIRPLVVGGYYYFAVPDANGSGALWRSDGTAQGNLRLSPRTGHLPNGASLASLGLRVYFPGGQNGATGTELWSTDGTVQGTRELIDIHPTGSSTPSALTAIGNAILMAADDGKNGAEPWRTDGTATGTRMIANFANWVDSSEFPRVFTHDDEAWFLLEKATSAELWRTDGTRRGTFAVRIPPYYVAGRRSVLVGAGKVFFNVPQGQALRDMWTSDGTQAGTRLFKAGVGWIEAMVDLGDVAVFTGGPYSQDMWRTDGTPAGTYALGATAYMLRIRGARLARIGNRVWFADVQGRLSVTDGSVAGTRLVAATSTYTVRSPVIRFGHRIAFLDVFGGKVVITDGTIAGTTAIRLNSSLSRPLVTLMIEANSGGVFVAVGEGRGPRTELWFSDGTAGGTRRLATSMAAAGLGGVVWKDRLHFLWHDPATGFEPWVSDGTVLGTYLLRDLEPGPVGSVFGVGGDTSGIGVGSRFLYFRATTDLLTTLWRTDGTSAGTQRVYSSGPTPLTAPLAHVGGRLMFFADDARLGNQPHVLKLWANTQTIGKGCATGNQIPALHANDPILGGVFQLTLDSQFPRQAAVALFGAPAASIAQQLRLPGGCVIPLDTRLPTLLVALRTDASGRARLRVALPFVPTLVGVRLVAQTAVGVTATRPLGSDLSPGLSLTLGR